MNRQGRILVVDDLEKWRDEVSASLIRAGFHVDAVDSPATALQRLSDSFYHLMVLDIRMVETDPDNVEGMDFLRSLDERGEAMKIVVLSAHGTKGQMREAFKDYKIADFIQKEEFDNHAFLQSVREVFSESNINLALDVHWEGSSTMHAVINLIIDNERVKRDSVLSEQIAPELDDLLCRLFFQAQSLRVRPMTPGRSGAGVLWVEPFNEEGAGRRVIVKFGDQRKIDLEYRNFKEYVEPFIGGGRTTTVLGLRRTPRLGGIEYSLLGTTSEQLESFESFYRRASVAQISETLDRLFFDTCANWYASPSRLKLHDLTADYEELFNLSLENLGRTLFENLKSVQGKRDLYFKALGDNRSFTNPILALGDQHVRRSTYVCITHGDFNENNILVDENGETWLIDFLRTGRGHILRDVAQLDSVVRLNLLASEEASLDERLKLEETLCKPEKFDDLQHLDVNLLTENAALAKAYSTVLNLRLLAAKLVARNPHNEISEYYAALTYYALNSIRFYSTPTVQREHALLSACLLVDRLGL
jgi:Response regulator containing CheY-like receiver, AAA-type ATPase, and DNA-binding domains